MSFLGVKDLVSFAKTCKQYYNLAASVSSDTSREERLYPSLLIEALGKGKLAIFPFSALPNAWQVIFSNIKAYTTVVFEEGCRLNEADLILMSTSYNMFNEKELTSLMKNEAIQKIQRKEGPAVIFRLKDNILNKELTFVLAKENDKWMIVTRNLSGGMWIFLNDIRYHEDAPKVVDYLKRLFKGEPCGSFPEHLNSAFQTNFPKDKASEILNEGPRTCADGVTPVIQLWPQSVA